MTIMCKQKYESQIAKYDDVKCCLGMWKNENSDTTRESVY